MTVRLPPLDLTRTSLELERLLSTPQSPVSENFICGFTLRSANDDGTFRPSFHQCMPSSLQWTFSAMSSDDVCSGFFSVDLLFIFCNGYLAYLPPRFALDLNFEDLRKFQPFFASYSQSLLFSAIFEVFCGDIGSENHLCSRQLVAQWSKNIISILKL